LGRNNYHSGKTVEICRKIDYIDLQEVIFMITEAANHIVDFIYSKNNLSTDERDIYVYGYEIIISSGITFMLLIITGLLFGKLIEAAAFFCVFYLLRRRTGGYHANTYFKCNLIFECNILLVMILSSLNIAFFAEIIINLVSFLLCLTITIIKAPVSNPNKPISICMQKKHKAWAIILIIFFEILSIAMFKIMSFSICISLAMASTAFAMIINSKD